MNKKIVFLRGFNEKPVTESGLESRFKLQCSSGNKGFVLQVIVCDCIYPLACGVLSLIHSHHSSQPRLREPSNRNIKGLASAHEISQFVIKIILTSKRFSQNSCLGFSCVPCFKSVLTLLSCVLYTVTGCLKIDAVCRMGGTNDASERTPLSKSK